MVSLVVTSILARAEVHSIQFFVMEWVAIACEAVVFVSLFASKIYRKIVAKLNQFLYSYLNYWQRLLQ